MTDGYATDDYERPLELINRNKWFTQAAKIAFALGQDPDKAMLAQIVGSPQAVISTTDLDTFSRLIRFTSVTASLMVSQSYIGGKSMGEDIVSKIAGDLAFSSALAPEPKVDPRPASYLDELQNISS